VLTNRARQRLGLNVVGAKLEITTTFESIKESPSLEEVLKLVAVALVLSF